jgi:hydroxyacyl-ACP dehydratase HTD2-like protein with hotdog domain
MNDQVKQLSGALNASDAAPPGTKFPAFSTRVDRARQEHYHSTTDIAGGVFGELADISIFTQDVARAIANAGLPNDGRILVRQRLFQTGRITLDEVLSVEAEVMPYGEGPRGRYLNCHIAFRRANRTVPLRMMTEHLLPYGEAPAPRAKSSAKRGDPRDGMELVGRLNLSPEKVMGYSEEAGNQIHFDPEFAAARGYRAPLAQGPMQLTALHGAIVGRAMPWEMDIETRFLRPVFWDSELTLYGDADGRLYRCIDQDGRLTVEAVVKHLTTVDMEP